MALDLKTYVPYTLKIELYLCMVRYYICKHLRDAMHTIKLLEAMIITLRHAAPDAKPLHELHSPNSLDPTL